MSTLSHDDRPFASGLVTTQSSGSEVICMEAGNQGFSESEGPSSGGGPEIPMDTTQSSVEESEETDHHRKSKTRTTAINISPLKIAYEKPQICSRVHFKTATHITATCLIPFILVDTVFIFAHTRFHHGDDVNVIWEPEHARDLAGPANVMALGFSFCHVAIWYWRRESTQRSANLTFWVTMLTTGCLTVSGFLLWTAHPHYMPRQQQQQIVVPFQYVSFFGSVIAWSVAGVAMYYEWQASKYAVVY